MGPASARRVWLVTVTSVCEATQQAHGSLLCRSAVVLFVVLPAASGLALQVALHVKSSSGAGPIGDINGRKKAAAAPRERILLEI